MADRSDRVSALDDDTEIALLSRDELEELVQARTRELGDVIDAMADVLVKLDAEARIELANETLASTFGYDIDAIEGKPIEALLASPEQIEEGIDTEVLSPAEFSELLIREGEVTDIEAAFSKADGSVIPMSLSTSIQRSPEGDVEGFVCVAKDISERIERERLLEHKNSQLEASNARLEYERDLKEQIRDTLINISTQGDLELAFCNSAVGEERVLAWVGEESASGEVSIRTSTTAAGHPDIPEPLETTLLAERALETGTTVVENDLETIETEGDRDAVDAGLQSGIAIPLDHGDLNYGVFCVFAVDPDAFVGREQALLEDTAESLAFSIHAAVQRESLRSEEPMRVVFDVHGDASYLSTLTNEAVPSDGSIEVREIRRGEDTDAIQILTPTNVDSDAIRAELSTHDAVLSIEAMGDDSNTIRVRVAVPTVQSEIADLGGAVRSTTVGDGRVRVVSEFSRRANLEEILAQLRESFPNIELASRVYVDRSEETHRPLSSDLTEKQLNALRTAYVSGFFNRPQQATANEVADMLDVSRTTFLHHLRAAERQIFESMLEE